MKKFIEYSSPWAFLISFSLVSLFLSLISSMKIHEMEITKNNLSLLFSLIMFLLIMMMWFRDSFRETITGSISDDILSNTKFAIVLFLISEAFFFVTFFWMYMYSSLAPELNHWPPVNLWLPSFMGAPSLNTILLVSSSATVTMSYFESSNKNSYSLHWLIFTLILSFMFISIQALEYMSLPFDFTDGVGGAIFFMATGFHGMHVIIGTIALLVCMFVMLKSYFTTYSMISFELSIWYWHFVDAIWLMLFTIFYCWGH
uniref:cytochrome c oxidase subunit III n=1 Tax=Aonchotheca putorii TaxID=1647945 RepID=UPI00237AF67E|nr:cytochrome c oxidase subunit III [Aonchotheca putorii]WBV76985.1 cytochrome c oxidase subunit 3 [Aonchotheca putorii]